MASSSIVIKVKFGETLRRLNVSINDKKLALDMVMLKEKIRSLFSFGSDVEFTLTYVDEDGDEVTLADDGDLLDVVSQSLNPLRITVSLKGSNFNGPSGNSTPLSSQNQHPFQTLNSGVSEVLKSIPEPLLEALAKLPLDLASKASSSSAPAVAELVDKVKDVYSNQILPSMASLRVQPITGGPPNMNSESSTVKNSQVQVNPEAGDLNSKKKKKQVQKVTDGAKSKGVQAPISSTKSVGEASTGKNKDATDGVDKKKDSSSEKKDDISSDPLKKPLKHDSFVEHMNQMRQNYKNQWHHLQDQLAAQRAQYGTNQCPFSGMPLTTDYDFHGHHHRSRSPHWKRYNFDNNNNNMNNHNNNNNNNNNNMNNNNNNTGNIFHRGIICDGCGVHPITGPRFKSKVKIDYDLCSICFAEMGNATDYIRMDHPTSSFSHHLMSLRGLYDPSLHIPPPGTLPHTMQTPGSNLSRSKLDSRFILDVSVLDGTTMAPYTAFTKIWRMQNNGSVVWPYGSQLQWIGGDCLSNSHSVDVEIPVHGLLVNKEVDIAVDLTAPELPGRYVSYWRMSSPSGEKFGQQVWVVIQVDAPVKNLGETSINLNLPPVTRDLEAVNHDRLVDNIFSENDIITDLENTSVDTPPKDHAKDFPINDSLIINSGGVSSTMATLSAPPETASSSVLNSTEVGAALGSLPAGSMVTSGLDNEPISPPTVDFSVMPPIMSSGAASLPTVVLQPPSGSVSQVVTDDKEQALVKELEAMGFMNLDLNKEILRIHNYDLDKSIDDLCGILEWDPILDELREMGFVDDEANRRLLKKNNGSIKGVVMDLISEEKA